MDLSDKANLLKLAKLLLPDVRTQLAKNVKMKGRGLKLPGERSSAPVKRRMTAAQLEKEVLRILKKPELTKLLSPKGVQQGSGILSSIIKAVAPFIVTELLKLGTSIVKKIIKKKKKKSKRKAKK